MATTPVGEERVPVVGFVGPSGVGKTTLLERLIAALRRRGLAVGAVKHSSHGFLADRPGKDSYRLYESGAGAVAVISREQLATFTRRGARAGEGEVSLAGALASLPPGLDVVLAEGFSWEPIPRVVLHRGGEEPLPEHLGPGEVLERVCVPGSPGGKAPVFSDSLVESIVQKVVSRVGGMERGRRGSGGAERPARAADRTSA